MYVIWMLCEHRCPLVRVRLQVHVPKIPVALLDFFLNIWFISFSVDNSFSFVHCAFDFLFFFLISFAQRDGQ